MDQTHQRRMWNYFNTALRGSASEGGWKASDVDVVLQEIKQAAKFAQYALAATDEALGDAGIRGQEGLEEMTGVCLGSGIGNLQELYETSVAYGEGKNYRKIHPLFVPRILINLGAGHISMRYGFRGPNHTATTACTTGAHSIGDAMRFIQHGDADVMVAGGAESCIHPLAIGGFARSRSLATDFNETPESSSRPFDKDRAGFVIGEGAAVLILEELEHARARKANIYAEILGYGCSADAHHITAPRENGAGALQAMRRALKQAQIAPSEVDYINAHATSTSLGDAAENAAIKTLLLGEAGKSSVGEINVSSTKGAIGHLLGAAGAVEALFSVLAIRDSIMPPTLNLENRTTEFDCNYASKVAQERKTNVALTNSFGFGGTNASLCFRKYD
ncbi:Mitochondrial beta-keto-acyl synthase [Neophaeococcomyces mojaviensis]|uniref:Mitochondrial beta-keto-acyl synthase n=1 Tax=Neophaeococcomyces mojaviensis TaxID=3383035 RepID=A0ACC3A903_9EURO|nr:Mitochondrial beta-keto-acyl synthase [Knufia sp. JES_112]